MVLIPNEVDRREIKKNPKDHSVVKVHTCTGRYKTPTKIVGFCDFDGQATAKIFVTEQRMYVSEHRGKSCGIGGLSKIPPA